MDWCSCCASEVPDGQGVCSMCYGDPSFGSDGYYEAWIEEQHEQERQEREREQREYDYMELLERLSGARVLRFFTLRGWMQAKRALAALDPSPTKGSKDD